MCFYHDKVMHPKDADRMANSVDPVRADCTLNLLNKGIALAGNDKSIAQPCIFLNKANLALFS